MVAAEAQRAGMPYVDQRWLGGMLTNFKTVKGSLKRLKDMQAQIESGTEIRIKKEALMFQRDIAKLENTHQSLMPMGFGALPDETFRDLMWFILAPPEEGKLTAEKKAALAAPVTEMTAPPASRNAKQYPKIDWESVSLWNPDWKVTAPEFEARLVAWARAQPGVEALVQIGFVFGVHHFAAVVALLLESQEIARGPGGGKDPGQEGGAGAEGGG